MEIIESKEWYMSSYAPEGVPASNNLKMRNVKLNLAHDGSIPPNHVAVQILYLSVDPYLRARMTGHTDGLYFSQFNLNQVILAFGIGRVIKSKNENYNVGDIIMNPFLPVAEYCVVSSDFLKRIDATAGIELPDYLSCLGVPGFAAWVGIEILGKPKQGSNVFISAAAGGVGMFAGQIAKIKGCRVIGSVGSDDKAKLAKEEFGYDEAFNYNKETDYNVALAKYFPNGIDIYLDNVGGEMLEATLNHVNSHARIPVCGMISDYNKKWSERRGVRNLLNIVGKEVKMEGFLVGSYLDRFDEFTKEMGEYMKQGKIKSKHMIYHGIDTFLESLVSIFSGSNIGKVVIQVSP